MDEVPFAMYLIRIGCLVIFYDLPLRPVKTEPKINY